MRRVLRWIATLCIPGGPRQEASALYVVRLKIRSTGRASCSAAASLGHHCHGVSARLLALLCEPATFLLFLHIVLLPSVNLLKASMAINPGFAIRRNGSCLAGGYEVDCGQTRTPFRLCCPTGLECPSQQNFACCSPENISCTSALLPEPKCANATWDLFDNEGYFCCEHGLPGYNIRGTHGCASPGFVYSGGEESLSTVQAGQRTFQLVTAAAAAAARPTAHTPQPLHPLRPSPQPPRIPRPLRRRIHRQQGGRRRRLGRLLGACLVESLRYRYW